MKARGLLFVAACQIFWGCGGNPRESAGPDTVPVFEISTQPSQISPPANAQIFLTPIQLNAFGELQGLRAYFTSSSGQGFFTPESSRVDTDAVSKLEPAVWYSHAGSEQNTVDTLQIECYDNYFELAAWDTCTITILGGLY